MTDLASEKLNALMSGNVMLTAYFDESENTPERSKPDKLRVYTIAGCIGFDREWIKLNKKWKALLEKEVLPKWREVYGNDRVYFHMTDFANPHSKIYRDWPEDKRTRFLARLHGLMAKHTLRRVATGILINDYDQLTDEEKFVIGHPHAAATINCLKRIREWAIRENRKEPMLYVFEKGSVHDEKVRRMFETVLSLEQKMEYRISDLDFGDKRDVHALQTSDILAVESRWEICRELDPAITRQPRKSLQNLLKPKIDDWYFLDRTHMHAILQNPVVKKNREAQDLTEYVALAKKRRWI